MLDQLFRDMAGAAQEAARQPEFTVVRRRGHLVRARRRVGVAAVALLAVAGLGSVAFLGTGNGTPDSIATSPSGSWTPPPDGEHIYLAVQDCIRTCRKELFASGDGGRTWRSRGGVTGFAGDLTVVGPEVLLAYRPDPPDPAATPRSMTSYDDLRKLPITGSGTPVTGSGTWMVSVDGGRNWKDVAVGGDPAATVSAGTRAVDCDVVTDKEPCKLHAVDPASGSLRPLANQPPLERVDLVETPAAAGIWVRGVDPISRRPATASSHDGGATWTTGVFDAEPVAAEPGRGGVPEVTTTNGTLAFAMFIGDDPVRVYRSTDGGATWIRTNEGVGMPDALSGPYSMITVDGTHVVTANDNGGFRYLASRDGRQYTRVTISSVPALGHSPRAVTPTKFLFSGADAIYTSGDGRVWIRHPLP